MENKIILEVGCSDGYHTKQLRDGYKLPLYGFEPVPHLQKLLQSKFANDPDVHIMEAAVDIEEGERDFFISNPNGQTDRGAIHPYGCSSLFPFAEDIDKKWPNRPDFKSVESVKVQTINLEKFFDSHNFKGEITYMHCDAQGNDLNVLKSLGKYLQNVKEGIIEVAWKTELYSGVDNTYKTAANFLTSQGFAVSSPPSGNNHEANLHFINKNKR
jgi:FkbM family methyltransferase